jgi:hypothetical protein
VVLLAVFGDPYIGPMKALTVDTKRDHTECDRYCLVTLRASTSTEEHQHGRAAGGRASQDDGTPTSRGGCEPMRAARSVGTATRCASILPEHRLRSPGE